MKLEFLMEYEARLRGHNDVIGKGPFGTRVVANVEGGTCGGPRIRGRLLPSGGDWLVQDERGVTRLDVRGTIETDDGARIYVQYFGIGRPVDRTAAPAQERRATEYGEVYFMTAPRFETGDERYWWLNELVCVAEGKLTENGVAYRVYAVVND